MNTGDGERAKSVAHCSGCTVMAMDCRLVSVLSVGCSLLVHWLFVGVRTLDEGGIR